jgi:hypothetical protein
MSRIARYVVLPAVIAMAIPLAPVASAAPSADKPGTTTIVLYAENRSLARVDGNKPGPDNGDLVHREFALSRTQGGAVIGVSYAQSIIIAYNPEAKLDVRRVDNEKKLPGGMLFTEGISTLPIGSLPQPGWSDTYAVIGGTGKFAGARGTEKLTLLEDGKTFKVVITLMK